MLSRIIRKHKENKNSKMQRYLQTTMFPAERRKHRQWGDNDENSPIIHQECREKKTFRPSLAIAFFGSVKFKEKLQLEFT